jgi:hypothetical protein
VKQAFPWVALGLLLGLFVWREVSGAAQRDADRLLYQATTDSLRFKIDSVLAHRDTLILRVPVERVRIVRAAARVDTLRLGFTGDSTTGDSLRTAMGVIAAQDTVIQEQTQHIRTLSEIVASDSGIIRLFQVQRVTDSTRIKQLEPQTFSLFGLKLPAIKCGPGIGLSLTGRKEAGLMIGCFLALGR